MPNQADRLEELVGQGASRLVHLLFHTDKAGLPDLLTAYANQAHHTELDPDMDRPPLTWIDEQERGAVAMLVLAAQRLTMHDDSDCDPELDPPWLT